MRVAVTGGSGVVGRAVVRHLVDSGHHVAALSRSSESASSLESLGASAVPGHVLDFDALIGLVSGTDWVFHIAGVNELCSRDPSRMWRVNVDGSLLVLEASARAGVRRVVHTSSAVTVGEAEGTVGAESTKHRGFFLSDYERSKTVAERLMLETRHDIEVVSVNPASVQGPGRSTGTGALLLAAAGGRLPFLVDATISLVDTDDCARGHLAAADEGVPGERYLLSGATVTIREMVSLMNRVLERTRRPWFVNPGAISAIAPVVDWASRVLGIEPTLCPESARVLRHGHAYDGSRATRDLGVAYTPLETTVRRMIDWASEESLL